MIRKLFQTIILCTVLFLVSPMPLAMAQECATDSDCRADEVCQDELCGPKPIFNVEEGTDPGEAPEQTGITGIKQALGESSVTSTGSVRDLIFKYVNFALPLLALAAFVGFVYAGFMYVTAYGSEDQIGKAKKLMIYSVIGLILVILSYSIVQLFTVQLAEGLKK